MIKRQYRQGKHSYFNNFLKSHTTEMIDDNLKLYNATIAKSKNMNYIINVKWHDEKMYSLFLLRWS